ncbi:MAG: creatininase family protein [Bacillota bacterium]
MLHEMTRPAFEEYLESEPNPVAVIPLGSIEQHGPHLPLGTDSLAALAAAREVAERTNSFVVQVCLPGYSPHHLGFRGTITFKPETLTRVIEDTVESLAHHGVRKVLIVNAHGGNREIAATAARLSGRDAGSVVLMPSDAALRDPVETLRKLDVHAGAGETGLARLLFPELVEMERVKGFEPTARFPEEVEALRDPEAEDPALRTQLIMAYTGDSHEFSSSGVWGFADPNDSDVETARGDWEKRIGLLTKLVKMWKTIPQP